MYIYNHQFRQKAFSLIQQLILSKQTVIIIHQNLKIIFSQFNITQLFLTTTILLEKIILKRNSNKLEEKRKFKNIQEMLFNILITRNLMFILYKNFKSKMFIICTIVLKFVLYLYLLYYNLLIKHYDVKKCLYVILQS